MPVCLVNLQLQDMQELEYQVSVLVTLTSPLLFIGGFPVSGVTLSISLRWYKAKNKVESVIPQRRHRTR